MLTAKLLVPLGAPLQFRAGEILLPVQPKPLNTCSLAMVPPSLMSGLLRERLCALAALTVHAEMRMPPSAAFQTVILAMPTLPFGQPGSFCFRPAAGSHSNFPDGVEASEPISEMPRPSFARQAFPGGDHERSNPHPAGG